MERSMIKPYIAARVAQEFRNEDMTNLGIGLPTLIPNYPPQGAQIALQSENGIMGMGKNPEDLIRMTDAGGIPASAASGGSYVDSAISFGLTRGGHVDCTVLGALEVDARGSLANQIIPGKKVPGMGGAMDLAVGVKKVIVTMEHTARGKHKILTACTLPYTAVSCVNLIIIEMCVFQVTDEGLALTEYNPEFTLEDIRAATGAELTVSNRLRPMEVRIAQVS